jgi:hypothetical protein
MPQALVYAHERHPEHIIIYASVAVSAVGNRTRNNLYFLRHHPDIGPFLADIIEAIEVDAIFNAGPLDIRFQAAIGGEAVAMPCRWAVLAVTAVITTGTLGITAAGTCRFRAAGGGSGSAHLRSPHTGRLTCFPVGCTCSAATGPGIPSIVLAAAIIHAALDTFRVASRRSTHPATSTGARVIGAGDSCRRAGAHAATVNT